MAKPLRLVGHPHEPWFDRMDSKQCHGVLGNFFSYMISSLNLSYTFRKDYNRGVRMDNGTWTGIWGQMQKNVSEIFN